MRVVIILLLYLFINIIIIIIIPLTRLRRNKIRHPTRHAVNTDYHINRSVVYRIIRYDVKFRLVYLVTREQLILLLFVLCNRRYLLL